ncbi:MULTISPECIES: hypothetical protein [unclassified Nocardia]|uniref:hypothetical protein n=1 Tax=unclassified Nocardia TaxID=2637762 RepID=UPI001CE3BC0D|nr:MULTISPECIES: hypothetical protein [unclassified Nocardia]
MDTETEPDRHDDSATTPAKPAPAKTRHTATISIPVATLGWGAGFALLVIAVCVLTGFLWAARTELADHAADATADRHAEQAATTYAVGASTIDYQDLNAWLSRLQAGTTPQLAQKFASTAPKLHDILVPLKWTSTATPVTAKVISRTNAIYQVDVFIDVSSTNAQNPDGGRTTVTYNVTIDKNSDWKITDVGGPDGPLPIK